MTRWRSGWLALGVAAGIGIGGGAQAHELTCTKTVNGESWTTINRYPATLTYHLTVTNVHPTDPSTATSVSDPMLMSAVGQDFTPAAPFTLGVGQSVSDDISITLSSFEECADLAGGTTVRVNDQPPVIEATLDNTLFVTTDLGGAQCSARVVCIPPIQPPQCAGEMCSPNAATRTMGFFKVHEQALQQCLNQGPIDLGQLTVSTLDDALGVLWGSPAELADGTARSTFDRTTFLLERQLLTATCNVRLFGATPTPSTLIATALTALSGTDCSRMNTLEADLDAFNNSNDSVAFPSGFNAGPATPTNAQSIATDPTMPSTLQCTN